MCGRRARAEFIFAFGLLALLLPNPARASAEIAGQLRARGTRAPIVNARVTLRATVPGKADQAELSSTSDEAGKFQLRAIPAGIYRVFVRPPGGPQAAHRSFESTVTLRANERVSVTYYLSPTALPAARAFEAVVHADDSPLREEISRQTLSTEELSKIPGTFGDPLRAIENLPGAARPPFNTGLFIIEGGRPSDSRVNLGAAEVPQLYHYGALTSVVPAGFIDSIEFLPHNFGVRYGRATAGTIDVDLRAGKRDRWHGALEVNPIHVGLEAEGPLSRKTAEGRRATLLLGVRRSYVDAGLAFINAVGSSPPGLRFVQAPVYWDYQAVLNVPVKSGSVRLMVLGSDDQISLRFARPQDVDPSINGQFSTHIMFHRVALRWRGRLDDWELLAQNTTGYTGTELALGRGIALSIYTLSSDTRLEARRQYASWLRLLVGADVQAAYLWMDALVPAPLREGEFQRPPGVLDQVKAQDQGFLLNPAFYAELALQPHERLRIVSGLRIDYFSYLGRLNIDPRLSSRLRVSPVTWLKLGLGLYGQDPASQDYFSSFGNDRLRLERAAHVSFAVEQAVWKGLMLELTGLYKQLWDFAGTSTLNRRFGPGREPSDVRPERTASGVAGRIYGGTLLLRQQLSRYFFGWLSYSLLRSERRDCDACTWRLFDYDQTHVLILAAHAYLPHRIEVGIRFRFISGFPFTPVRGGYYDSDVDLYQPQLPANELRNSERMENFHQLDVRIDRTFTFKTWLLKVYLDVSNLYSHPSAEQTVYNFDYTGRAALTGLPILPSLGVRAEL